MATSSSLVSLPAVTTTTLTNTTTQSTAQTSSSTTAQTSSISSADPVVIALSKLSQTAVNNLWEEKVTNSAWYAKLPGLISYLWNKSAAAAEDKQFGATIEQFNTAKVELVKAVAQRGLTPQESIKLGIPSVKFKNASEQSIYAQAKLDSEDKLKAFYDVFKERLGQLNIGDNHNDFGIYAAAGQKAILDFANGRTQNVDKGFLNGKVITKAILPHKVETAVEGFNQRIFSDMVNGYAVQSLENITIDSFKQVVQKLKGFFDSNDTVDIEAKLRQATKAKHDSTQFNTHRTEFLNPAANAPRYVAARAALETKLNAEKTILETELNALCGPNRFDGTLNAAYQEREAAQREVDQAYSALVSAFQQPTQGLNANDRDATLRIIIAYLGGNAATSSSSGSTSVARVQELLSTYQQKLAAFEQKKSAHEALVTRFTEIAVFTNNQITGGRISEINANLQTGALDAAARAEVAKIANFYNELNLAVGENNLQARSDALHRIIGQ